MQLSDRVGKSRKSCALTRAHAYAREKFALEAADNRQEAIRRAMADGFLTLKAS